MRNQVGEWMRETLPGLAGKRAFIGFDGFVDEVAQVKGIPSMAAFAGYLQGRQERSGLLELAGRYRKLGGNMPITAHALGSLGAKVEAVGALGAGQVDEAFLGMSSNCALHPLAAPGTCLALEFGQGKLMLADNESLDELSYERLVHSLGREGLINTLAQTSLLACLNWGETRKLEDILSGLLALLPSLASVPATVFFDLSDNSQHQGEDIRRALSLMGRFSVHSQTVLSLNENEYLVLKGLYAPEETEIQAALGIIREATGLHALVVRDNHQACCLHPGGFDQIPIYRVEEPKILTGAGDHYNAGMMAALMLQADWPTTLRLGSLTASHYITTGHSASMEELIHYQSSRGNT